MAAFSFRLNTFTLISAWLGLHRLRRRGGYGCPPNDLSFWLNDPGGLHGRDPPSADRGRRERAVPGARVRGDERPRHRERARHPGRACTPTSRPRRTCSAAIVERSRQRFERAERAARTTAGGDAASRLSSLIRAHIFVVTADPGSASVFVDEWRHLSEPARRRSSSGATPTRRASGTSSSTARATDRRDDRPGARRDVPPHGPQRDHGAGTAEGHLAPDQLADAYADLALRSARSRRPPDDRPPRPRADPPADRARAPASTTRRCRTTSASTPSSRTSRPAARSRRATGCPTSTARRCCASWRCTPTRELMGVLPEREWIMRAPTLRRKLALTAKVQDEVRPRPAALSGGRGPRQDPRGDVPGPARGQDEVPQRLPLPDQVVGRHRDHRLARRRRRDRRPAGAARLELRPVRPDDEEDLLGGVGPHHARAGRGGDAGRPGRRASATWSRRRSTAGGAR